MPAPSRVLVTGANGFVGRAVCRCLAQHGWTVRGAVRRFDERFPDVGEPAVVGDIDAETDWRAALAETRAVVHLAARVHVMRDSAADPLAEFRRTNVEGTLNLARQAAAAGVGRLVFVSSVKVMGEGRAAAYADGDAPAPEDAYGMSKLEAEEGLRKLAADSGMELVILRPPLVYGPGVGANFRRLLGLVDRGFPLPFAGAKNRRSLIYVGNLAGAIRACIEHPAAAGKAFLVSDGEDVSTAELVARMATALGRTARLYSVPPGLMRWAGRMLGRSDEIDRLVGSMYVDSSRFCRTLGWSPPFSLDEGLRETAQWARQP